MWQQFLKSTQQSIVVPPGFRNLSVVGTNKCVYKVQVKRPLTQWSVISAEGMFVRVAQCHEIIDTLKHYPKILGCIVQIDPTVWIIIDQNKQVCRVQSIPDTVESPTLLTPIVCRRLGSVIVFDDYDLRYHTPWRMQEAVLRLHEDPLVDGIPQGLTEPQKICYTMLFEHEKSTRIPKTEEQIRTILSKEGARLFDLSETSEGYTLKFQYRGRTRKVKIREDLMLLDSGMCLNRTDRNYSLDTFLAILEHEDSGEYGHPVYY